MDDDRGKFERLLYENQQERLLRQSDVVAKVKYCIDRACYISQNGAFINQSPGQALVTIEIAKMLQAQFWRDGAAMENILKED